MRWLVLSTMVMWAATCGQKGPLQLPHNETLTNQVATTAVYAATPLRRP